MLLIPYLISMWFFSGKSTLISIISHVMYIRIKVMMVYASRYSYGEVIEYVMSFKLVLPGFCSKPIDYVVLGMQKFVS